MKHMIKSEIKQERTEQEKPQSPGSCLRKEDGYVFLINILTTVSNLVALLIYIFYSYYS